MKCPYCAVEMELGYIQCRDGITWTPKRQPVAALSILGRGSKPIVNDAADNSKTVHAHRCRDCRKIIIEYL